METDMQRVEEYLVTAYSRCAYLLDNDLCDDGVCEECMLCVPVWLQEALDEHTCWNKCCPPMVTDRHGGI